MSKDISCKLNNKHLFSYNDAENRWH